MVVGGHSRHGITRQHRFIWYHHIDTARPLSYGYVTFYVASPYGYMLLSNLPRTRVPNAGYVTRRLYRDVDVTSR